MRPEDEPNVDSRRDSDETLDEIIAEFLQAAGSSTPPDRNDFLGRYPDHRVGLESFFADYDAMHAATGGQDAEGGFDESDRYEILGEIARGGMGAVLRAVDRRFDRPVALKLLRPDRDRETLRRRFELEAKVTGRLQHPGIPPVHDRGTLTDGQLYLAMKLIEGRTLQELLDERESPSERLSYFLGVFEQICRTLAYAHSQGVVHRDLKPLNVMVGAFGEVQVMDWGMARELPRRADSQMSPASDDGDTDPPETPDDLDDFPETIIADVDTGDDERMTVGGQVMGTPSYMPPEQARGIVTQLDERSDVFGLGGILCYVLTGAPPYRSTEGVRALEHARSGNVADALARIDASSADEEVRSLAGRCLAPDRDDRPADANVVWTEIAEHLEAVRERLERERVERAAAEARAEADRRRRRVATLLAGVVVLTTLLVAFAASWYVRDRARRTAEQNTQRRIVESRVRLALDDANEELDALDGTLADAAAYQQFVNDAGAWERRIAAARARLERAESIAAAGRERLDPEMRSRIDTTRKRIEKAEFDRIAAAEFDMIRFGASTMLAGRQGVHGPIDGGQLDHRFLLHLRRIQLDIAAADVVRRVLDSPIRFAILDGLDFWAIAPSDPRIRTRLLEITRKADPDEFRDRLRDPDLWEDREALEKLAAEPIEDQPAGTLQLLAILLRRAGGDPVPMLHRAISARPRDFALHYTLAACSPIREESIGAFRAALAVRPDAVPAHDNLGRLLVLDGKIDAAVIEFEASIAQQRNNPVAHNNLGYTMLGFGRLDEAERYLRRAIALRPRYEFAHNNLGLVLERQGRIDDAIAHFQLAVEFNPNYANAKENLERLTASKEDGVVEEEK